jgi:hypothetical protein
MTGIFGGLSRQDVGRLLQDLEKLEALSGEYPNPGTEYEKKFLTFGGQRTEEYFPR